MIRPALWGWSSSPLSVYAWGWDEVGALTGIPHFVFDDLIWPIAHGAYGPQMIGHSYQAGRTVQGGNLAHVAMGYNGYAVNHAAVTGTRINRGSSALTTVRGSTHGGHISRGVTATRVSTLTITSAINVQPQFTPKIIR